MIAGYGRDAALCHCRFRIQSGKHDTYAGPYAGHDQRLLAGVARWFNKKRVIPCVYFYLAWNENGMRSSLMNFWHQRSVWPIRNRPSSEVISRRSGTGNSYPDLIWSDRQKANCFPGSERASPEEPLWQRPQRRFRPAGRIVYPDARKKTSSSFRSHKERLGRSAKPALRPRSRC